MFSHDDDEEKLTEHNNELGHDDDEETNLLNITMSLAITMMKQQT